MALIIILFSLLLFFSCGNQPGIDSRDSNSSPGLNLSYNALPYREGELLVKFKLHTATLRIQATHREAGATVKKRLGLTGIELVSLPRDVPVVDAIKRYKNNPYVEYVEPNYIVRKATLPDDPYFNLQWALNNTGQSVNGFVGSLDADIDAPEAWDIHTGNGSVIVAVIDTGVDYNHPDLSENIWINTAEDCTDGIDNDGNGYVDDCRGWNFAYNNNNPMDDDIDGHGTHVAGIIGALGNNGTGVSGVNWKVKIMPLKFLDSSGSGTMADVIEAIEYAIQMGARVINASYTYPQSCIKVSPSLAEREAIEAARNAGILFVAAAGNYGCNNDQTPFYPASHPIDNIISVAASDSKDLRPWWSNYGLNSVHVAAPGHNVYSTVRSNLKGYNNIYGYDFISGTSMAAPFVTGLAALIMSYHPDYSYKEVRETILSSVDWKGDFLEKTLSGGRINAFNALSGILHPLRPTNLSATPISSSEIDLSWTDNSSIEKGFTIERKTGINGSYDIFASLPANITSYRDTSVIINEGTAYYYRVKAFNDNGESLYSNETSIIIPPNAPSDLKAVAVSGAVIYLSWIDNSSVEDGFKIERKGGAQGAYIEIATVGADSTSYRDTGLSPSTTYYYRVRAYNNIAGFSDYSNEAGATTELAHAGDSSGCFIATAAYGSSLAPEVRVLREFRDRWLLNSLKLQVSGFKVEIPNYLGHALVKTYYWISPPIAAYIKEHEAARIITRWILTPVVYGIKYPVSSGILVIITIAVIIKRRKKSMWYN